MRMYAEDYSADKRVFSCIYFFFNSLTGQNGCFQINAFYLIANYLITNRLAVIYRSDK